MVATNPQASLPAGHVSAGNVPITAIHQNTGQEIIVTTVDKLKLALRDHVNLMERKREWVAVLGLVIALLVVFPTTDFKAALSLSADTWKAIFVISTAASASWLARSIYVALKSPSVNDLVEKIKKSAP